MRKIIFFILFSVLLWSFVFLGFRINNNGVHAKEKVGRKGAFDFVGEKIAYNVKLGMVSLGIAKFHYATKTELNGEQVDLMTFDTKVANFKDSEKIYSYSKTFLPIMVERSIRTWTGQEKITENYDQENFKVTINKTKGKKQEKMVIQKKGVIHNAIALPFYVRRQPNLSVGWSMQVRIPMQDFLMRLVSIEEVKVPAGSFMAYHFESTPEKFHIWISTDPRRIPVKIIGTGAIGYILAMKDYSLSK